MENAQVGAFLAYASRCGQALIDRQLYLPEAWVNAAERRNAAAIPEEISFLTKPAIARDMITAALDTGMPCAWVLADALYGSDSKLRHMLEARRQAYVLAVRSNHCLRMVKEHEGRSYASVRSWRVHVGFCRFMPMGERGLL
ncbi:transposase [Acidocella aminolytica]|uniref:transposase n=1 Tax=Acidocella aminolytica TaxID=33998 RepID=UPI0038D11D23